MNSERAAWRWTNVPLPEPHLVGLGIGLLLQLVAPWRLPWPAWAGRALGAPLLLAGLALAAWAVRAAAEVNLARPGDLVRGGPYAFGRNPMYVAATAVYAGVGLVAAAAWPLLLLPAVLLSTHLVVTREERSLEPASAPRTAATRPRSAATCDARHRQPAIRMRS